MRIASLALVGVTLAALAGCSRPPLLVRVHGKVTVNGLPLRTGTVGFAPDVQHGTHGPVSYAVLDEDGVFELTSDNGLGAVVGWHRVTVAPPPDSTDLIVALERYRDPELSGLRFEVKAGQENEFTIAITWEQ